MKKIFSLLLAVMLLVSAMSLSASAANTYTAPFGTPTIDGEKSEGEWDLAAFADMNNVLSNLPMLETPSFKVMHDGTYLYVLVEVTTPAAMEDDIFICVHVPHDGCTLSGCKSYIKFVIDGGAYANNPSDYLPWGYWADSEFDGVNDLTWSPDGEKTDLLKEIKITESNGKLCAELKIAANYENALPTDAPIRFDIRVDDNNFPPLSAQAWAKMPFTWDATFNPAEAGEITLLAEGEIPAVTDPVEDDEPAESTPSEDDNPSWTPEEETDEPVQTRPVETEPEPENTENTEKADTPNTDATDKEEPAASSFPIVPVVIAAVALIAIVIVVIVLAKKKKK